MPEIVADKKVFSLGEVMRSIQKTLLERYTSNFWIRAEMNKLNFYQQSGHCFPELVEKKEGQVLAELKSVLWRDDYARINSKFLELLHEPLKDGITILFLGKIQFDPVYGLSIRIIDIDPGFSLGELEREKQLAISRLQQEGIFRKNQQLLLPLLPKRIAIISVESSKGYSDFVKVLNGNTWSYHFFQMLFPAILQGDKSAASILFQLGRIKKVLHHFDAVAIIRGGGGDVGLTCYNNYELARAVATYPIPVITGIGHSTNETVTEMVAFKNAITPTELADFLIQQFHDFSVPVQEAQSTLLQAASQMLADEQTELLGQAKFLRSVSRNMINKNQLAISYYSKSVQQHSKLQLLTNRRILDGIRQNILKSSAGLVVSSHRQLSEIKQDYLQQCRSLFSRQRTALESLERMVQLLDPMQVLRRGYSITTVNGQLVNNISTIKKGDNIITTLPDGSVESTVTLTHKNAST